jgi:Holliday junction resolvase RusA-like endonuclease
MKEMFLINQKMPSLNDYVRANRANVHIGNKFKQDTEQAIGWAIKQAKIAGNLTPKTEPIDIIVDYYEKDRKRDVDNILAGGNKFILDALVKYEILPNDSRKYVNQVYGRVFDTPKKIKNSYCIVTLLPAGAVSLNVDI